MRRRHQPCASSELLQAVRPVTEPTVEPAPIAVFVYRRPQHAAEAVRSLLANPESATCPITVYCDGPRDSDEVEPVEETRRALRDLVPGARFVDSPSNLGLAESVIRGVTEQCELHGRVIVVEDDLILSSSAIRYMNAALERYQDEDRVMHVSAYMFPVRRALPPAFFYREATCWGWATWARAWAHFQSDPGVIQEFVRSRSLVSEFNVRDSMYFWEMLERQRAGRLDSWAIRWYGSMFMRGGLALHPARSLVANRGFDGTGVHCDVTTEYDVTLADEIPALPDEICECEEAVRAMVDHRLRGQYGPRWRRWLRRVATIIRGR
jgi:hypothetical protein